MSNDWFHLNLSNKVNLLKLKRRNLLSCGVPRAINTWLPFVHYIISDTKLFCIHFGGDTTLLSKGNNLDDLSDLISVCSTKSDADVHRVKIRH